MLDSISGIDIKKRYHECHKMILMNKGKDIRGGLKVHQTTDLWL